MMSACVIAIGDELLNGFTIDTNTQWLKKELSETDISVLKSVIIPDNESSILNELERTLIENYDFLIISGGLGPTHDDITKKTLATFFSSPLVCNEKYLKNLKERFKNYTKDSTDISKTKKMKDMILSQSLVLENFDPIDNKLGTALGMIGTHNNTKVIVLPGVPKELKQMFKDNVIPNYIPSTKARSIITLKTTGITESKLYLMLEDIIVKNKKNFKFSFLPHFSGVNIRILTLNNSSLDKKIINNIKDKLGVCYYAENDETLDFVVSNLLIEKNITISVAESCTGGLLSKKLTDYNGSSKYLIGSVVAYSNKIKSDILNVPDEILLREGAVSSEVALIMSDNIMKLFNSNIGVSITGISGPSGGTPEKPLGLYYISIKHDKNHFFKKFIFNINDRSIHREVVTNTALNLIRLTLGDL